MISRYMLSLKPATARQDRKSVDNLPCKHPDSSPQKQGVLYTPLDTLLDCPLFCMLLIPLPLPLELPKHH